MNLSMRNAEFGMRNRPAGGHSALHVLHSTFLLGVGLLALVLQAVAAEAPQPDAEVITNMARIWSFPEEARARANPVKLTVTVTFYDPAWGLLWMQEGTHGLFCAPKAPFPNIKPGQQIEISAFTRPGTREVSLSGAQYRFLSSTGLPAPRVISAPLPSSNPPDNVRCQVEGYVRRLRVSDDTHLRFEAVAGDMVVRVIVLATNASQWAVPEDSYVRLTGVFTPKFDRNKKLLDAQMVISGLEDIELLQPLASNSRFAVPRQAIGSLYTAPSNELARVQGYVLRQEPGVSVVIQDGTGSVTVDTWQVRTVKAGERVEAVGNSVAEGPELRLQRGMFRPVAEFEASDPSPELQELVLVEQIRQLSPEEAAAGHRVRITGVVTWADRDTDTIFLQSSSGGIGIVYKQQNRSYDPRVGDWLEVRGVTGDGGYSPVILDPEFSGRGVLRMPNPRPLALEQAISGVEDSQWVEMRGYVRSVSDAPGLARIEIATSSGSFSARLRTLSRLKELPGAIVRLRGVCNVLSNSRRQLTGVQLWVPDADEIIIEEEAPQDPFSVPLRSIASLGQFGTSATLNRRAKVAGIVTLNAGAYVYVQEDADGLLILTEERSELQPGDRVEAVGFPGRKGRRVVLRDAVFRKQSSGREPSAFPIDPTQPINDDLEGRLVIVEGKILRQSTTAMGLELTLQNQKTVFEARFGSEAPPARLKEVADGSHVALTGVYRINYSEHQAPEFFGISLRSPADVKILQRPFWWTPQRMSVALALVSILLLAGATWTAFISRRNILLQEQIQERQRAEAELQQAHAELERRVHDRTAELSHANHELKNEIGERERAEAEVQQAHKQLMEAARQAGMAEVATSVLHNVGNVLNSLNVSATLVAEGLKDSKITNLTRLAELLRERGQDLTVFLTQDHRGKQIPAFIGQLAGHLTHEQSGLLKEVQSLTENVEHIKQIVAMQQSYARVCGVVETIDPGELIEHALLMNVGALARHEVEVLRDYENVPPVFVDKHKVLQILINLIGNAKYAMEENPFALKSLRVRLQCASGQVMISISDNGVGIPKENLSRIFQHGFTTKKNGHGFGLHSSAIAARQLSGSLIAQSEGEGRGATFILKLPIATEVEQKPCDGSPTATRLHAASV